MKRVIDFFHLSFATDGINNAARPPRLRWLILTPLILVITGVIVTFSLTSFRQLQKDLLDDKKQVRNAINHIYNKALIDDAQTLAAAIEVFDDSDRIRDAMIRQDRQKLLQLSRDRFAELHAQFGITHLYYTSRDRVNLLRVHQPSRFGDTIDRFTMLEAERTGLPSHGIEIGPLGTFTLRYVYPIYVDKAGKSTLIGYIELGMEVEAIFDDIETMMGIGISAFINKSILHRKTWEEGMSMLGNVADWDRFRTVVTSGFHQNKLYSSVLDQITSVQEIADAAGVDSLKDDIEVMVIPIPLQDVRLKQVGYLLAISDVTAKSRIARDSLMIIITVVLLSGILLCLFFYQLLFTVEKRIIDADKRLRILATQDGLTGLLNQREFQSRLIQEIDRAQRYKKHLTMLMIDADFFKKVNDNYGHSTGDYVLKRISTLIKGQCRNTDQAYRYGGEEFSVLLPETSLAEGEHVAERIRTRIENDDFSGSGISGLAVTVSIGLSVFPTHANTVEDLAKKADLALYKAKHDGRNRVVSSH